MDPRALKGLGPLYHSFRLFGVRNKQLPQFRINQYCKEPILLGYIALAMGKVRAHYSDTPSFCELFCADGYFTMLAHYLGCDPAVGMDTNRDGWSDNMPVVAKRLGLAGVRFEQRDVTQLTEHDQYDIVANIGGLYHVDDPVACLRASYDFARRYLIVQSVVSAENDDPDYFVRPAPDWSHGNRYSRRSFIDMVNAQGYRILDVCVNQLEGNSKVQDQGSVYMLIEKTRA